MEVYLFAAILPVIVLCSYIYKKDVNREPNSVLRILFLYGCLTCIPIFFLEVFIQHIYSLEETTSFLGLFINVFVSIALVEESFKWLVVKKFGYNIREFDEIYDTIVYSVFASLGFACVENVLYVFSNGLVNAFLRAFTSVPGHTCFGVIMGYYLSRAKLNEINGKRAEAKENMFYSIFIPSILHTLYDAILLYSVAIESFLYVLLFLLFLVVMFLVSFRIVNKVSSEQKKLYTSMEDNHDFDILHSSIGQFHYCPRCGNSVDGCNYCSSCGKKVYQFDPLVVGLFF